jgi:hypothetical protein
MERIVGNHRLLAIVILLRVIVEDAINKSNHPIKNPLLLVTEPRTRDSVEVNILQALLSKA